MTTRQLNPKTPYERGFIHPAEFEKQEAVWLSWPHKLASWPGEGKNDATEIKKIFPVYADFIALLCKGQKVCINVTDTQMMNSVKFHLFQSNHYHGDYWDNLNFFFHPTNDAWIRDYGPSFLVNRETREKIIVDAFYNAWGGKYPECGLDDIIPTHIGNALGMEVVYPGIIMEGGAVDFNGQGTVLTTDSCLLNKNRNKYLGKWNVEEYLLHYYGASKVLWLKGGIRGDDTTDGHVDAITRFVNPSTIVTVVEHDKRRANYHPLKRNRNQLSRMRLENGKQIQVIEIPMPKKIGYKDIPELPCSYANFYIGNGVVVVPTFRQEKTDREAVEILQKCFPGRKVVGLDSYDLIWGLGSWHCLSQQEPAV